MYSFTSIDGDLSKAEDVFYGLGFMMALAKHDAENGKMTLVYTFRFWEERPIDLLIYVIILDFIFILNFIFFLSGENDIAAHDIGERYNCVGKLLRPPGGVSRTVPAELQIKSCSSGRLVLCHQKHLSMLDIRPSPGKNSIR